MVLLALLAVASVGMYVWATSVFGHDAVRTALASQLSKSLGQPVTVGQIDASIYPRVTVNLGDVAIGNPARIHIQTLHVGTDFRALLSRRIEHAVLRLTGAQVELPLPPFAISSPSPGGTSSDGRSAPVEIVSIDEIVLTDVRITSGGRVVRGDVELVPHDNIITIRRAVLDADQTTVEIAGDITNIAGPQGQLTAKASKLNFNRLLPFVSDFAARSGFQSSGAPAAAPANAKRAMDVVVSLDSESATLGALSLQGLSGRARITPDAMRLDPIRFGAFSGKYEGALQLSLGRTTDFKLNAAVSGVDMAALTAFMGSPDTITGRAAGKVDLAGRGLDPAGILGTSRGTARVEITNGIVKRLGLVRTIVVTMSGRSDAQRPTNTSSDEPFARIGATLAIADGTARTQDLRLESNDLLFDASGTVRLDGSAINLAGNAQLSDALSKQAGRDLVRYTQENGRVTLPLTITGSASSPSVRIDLVKATQKALIDRFKGIFGR